MERESIVSHCGLDSMLPPKVKFNRGDGIEFKGGLVYGGLGGPEPPVWGSNFDQYWPRIDQGKVEAKDEKYSAA